MVENIEFRNEFINRYADELNSRFLPERFSNHIDSLINNIKIEIPSHFDRWKKSCSKLELSMIMLMI